MESRYFGFGLGVSLLFVALLTACRPVQDIATEKRIQVPWAQRQLLFTADNLGGQVKVFTTRAAPQQVYVINAPGRRAVLDIKLDPARGVLWVLGDTGVHGYDLNHHRMPLRQSLPARGASSMALAEDGVLQLLDGTGGPLATVIGGRLVMVRGAAAGG